MDAKLEKRIKQAIKEVTEVYKKYHLATQLSVRLPKHNKVPPLARLAMWILMKHGAIIDTLYSDTNKK